MGAAEQFMEAFKVGYGIGDRIQTKRADTAIYEGLTELQTGLERIRSGAIPADDPNFINDLLSTRARINGQFASSSFDYDQLKDITTQYQGLDNQIATAVLGSALPRWGSSQSAELIGNYIMSGDPDTSYTTDYREHPETGEPVLVLTPSDGDPVMVSQQQAATMLELARGGGLGVWETNAGIQQAHATYEQTVAGTEHQRALTTQALPVDIAATEAGTEHQRAVTGELLPVQVEAGQVGIEGARRTNEALPTGEEAQDARALDREATRVGIEGARQTNMALPSGEEAQAERDARVEALRAGTEQTRRTTGTIASPSEARVARRADIAMSEAQRRQIEANIANMPDADRARAMEAADMAYREALTAQVERQTAASPGAAEAEAMRAAELAAREAQTDFTRAQTTDVQAQTATRPTGSEAQRVRDAELSNLRAGTQLTKAQTDAIVQETRLAAQAAVGRDFADLPAVGQLHDPDFITSYVATGGSAGAEALLNNRTDVVTRASQVAKAAAMSAGLEDMGADEAIELTIRGISPDAIPVAVRRQQNYERSQKRNNQLTAKQREDAARRAVEALLKLPILDEYRVD